MRLLHLRDSVITSIVLCILFASSSVAQEPESGESVRWIKADSKVIAVAEVARYLAGPEKERIAELSGRHPIVITHELPNAEAFSGLKLDDVARIVVSEELPAEFVIPLKPWNPWGPRTNSPRSSLRV